MMLIVSSSLGENLWTLSALYSFMLDRVTANDYESSLLVAILKVRILDTYFV